VLLSFYRKVRPHVSGWTPVARLASDITPTRDLGRNLLSWILGCAMVYAALFGGGWLIMGPRGRGVLFLAVAIVCGTVLMAMLPKRQASETAQK
jgi:hypothetical protein